MGTDTLTRLAAIDIGSNAVRLLLCNVVEEHGKLHFNKSELIRVPIRLGEDAFQLKRISKEREERFIKTMHAFKLLIDVYNPVTYRACATASMREAKNGLDIVQKVKNSCGLDIEIITGKEEAELIYANHVEQKLDHDADFLYVDVGGGSTEVTLFQKGICIDSRSFNIGTIRWIQGGIDKDKWYEMKDWVRQLTTDLNLAAIIGSGGNINKIHKLIGKKDKPLTYDFLKAFYDEIKILSIDERIDIWELNPDRADVIVPAAKIFLGIMKAARIPEIIVPQIGLADGIVHQLFESLGQRVY